MAEQDDIFGKIDALLEKRAGFGTGEAHEVDDFPLLTEVVEAEGAATPALERRQGQRRQIPDRRRSASIGADMGGAGDRPDCLSEAQFERLLAHLEQRLAMLFREQEARLQDALRRALREATSGVRPDEPL